MQSKTQKLELSFKPNKILKIIDKRAVCLTENGLSRLKDCIEKIKEKYGFDSNIKLTINGTTKTHFGFGTGTAIRLGCLEALFILNKAIYTHALIRELSNRGGTSGIGIHTYSRGGWVFDIGHRGVGSDNLLPSNILERENRKALLLQQTKMPPWEIGLCIPLSINPKGEKQEEIFFRKTCPVDNREVYKTIYHALFGLHASVLENNIESFCHAVKAIQVCSWKKAERDLYGSKLLKLEKALYQSGATAVGMTGLGPALFFYANDVNAVIINMHKKKLLCELIHTLPANRGRIIINA